MHGFYTHQKTWCPATLTCHREACQIGLASPASGLKPERWTQHLLNDPQAGMFQVLNQLFISFLQGTRKPRCYPQCRNYQSRQGLCLPLSLWSFQERPKEDQTGCSTPDSGNYLGWRQKTLRQANPGSPRYSLWRAGPFPGSPRVLRQSSSCRVQRPEEGIGSPGTGGMESCELPCALHRKCM